MSDRARWHLLSLISMPLLLLSLSGLFGPQAREEAQVAAGDLAAYGRFILPLAAVVGTGVVLGVILLSL
jgi:hypothetical protein